MAVEQGRVDFYVRWKQIAAALWLFMAVDGGDGQTGREYKKMAKLSDERFPLLGWLVASFCCIQFIQNHVSRFIVAGHKEMEAKHTHTIFPID